jgi:hypothetical protein
MEKKRKKMGRPRKPLTTKCSEQLSVHVTKAERAILEAEAKRCKLSFSALLMRPWRERRK